jgi:hypothetical protein
MPSSSVSGLNRSQRRELHGQRLASSVRNCSRRVQSAECYNAVDGLGNTVCTARSRIGYGAIVFPL